MFILYFSIDAIKKPNIYAKYLNLPKNIFHNPLNYFQVKNNLN